MPQGARLPDEARAALVADYRAGMTYANIASKYGISDAGAWHILRQEGIGTSRIKQPSQAAAAVAADTARIVLLYVAGWSAVAIEAKTGVTKSRVKRLLLKAGVPLRNGLFTPEEERQIATRYEAGAHPKVVAAEYAIAPVTVQDIARRHGVRIRGIWETRAKHPLREDAFETITPESAYWIGMLMADGWVKPPIGEVGLALATGDATHVEAFRDFLGYGGKITIKPPRKSPSSENMTAGAHMISVRSRAMCADLARYGISTNKSRTAKACDELVPNHDFWRGVIDGDGSVGWHRSGQKRYPYITLCGTRALVSQFQTFIRSFTKTTASVRPDKSIWRIHVVGVSGQAIISRLYGGAIVALSRKANMADTLIHYSA